MAMFAAKQHGPLEQISCFEKRIAGADSNVAIGLARLGFKVTWLSRVGDDSLGRFILDTLTQQGLDCSHVAIDGEHPTGFLLKACAEHGQDPKVEYFRQGSAASYLSPNDLKPSVIQARHLHTTGILPAISSSARELSQQLLQVMRNAGHTISFDPNLRPSLWPNQSVMIETLNALAIQANWVLPGIEEGQLLTGYRDPKDIASFYIEQGCQVVVVKLGAEGAYFQTPTDSGFVSGYSVANVVDTVGAGDAFAVGVISALLEERPLQEAVARGNQLGSRAIQNIGDMEGLPLRHELQCED